MADISPQGTPINEPALAEIDRGHARLTARVRQPFQHQQYGVFGKDGHLPRMVERDFKPVHEGSFRVAHHQQLLRQNKVPIGKGSETRHGDTRDGISDTQIPKVEDGCSAVDEIRGEEDAARGREKPCDRPRGDRS